MTGDKKKLRRPVTASLPPLAPEMAASLLAQVEEVKSALASGQELETVQGLVSTHPQDLGWDLHLLSALGALTHPSTPALLVALFGSSPDKLRRKALKRALHLLKTRGVTMPTELWPRDEAAPVRSGPRAPGQAFASPILGRGERYVILEGPREFLGGNFLVARISDQEGFQECHLLNLKRRQQQEFWDNFRDSGVEWLPVPTAYAVHLLNQAYEANPQGEGGANRYRALRDQIWAHWGHPGEAAKLESLLPTLKEGERSRYLEVSGKLAWDPLFHSWQPAPTEVAPLIQKLKEVQESALILSGYQKQVRLEGVVEEATRALYPLETRGLWARRLLAMAYYLDLQGRPEEARAAQAAAEDLAPGERGPLSLENPFLKGLVESALRLALEAIPKAPEAPATSGLIAPPTDSLLIRR